MSAGFTPGPWHVETCASGEDCWCRIIGRGECGSDSLDDCVIAAGAVSKRDAHLIAAAPDLYAALGELHLKAVVGTDDERHTALHNAWAALCKARGVA